ncbi:SDR family oxidoreductase [Chitinimonas koreensis]|uniref:SDR family oxidoreductase n=1 Tax=Chitinimonas koreensis TaxID=356302 RepID=UPI000411135B|nr:SDR family oxidoreductase [Chitinimonas koreensis]QNM98106.1 glucose 1-dehydrogenase [Chitinimonas koreensis]
MAHPEHQAKPDDKLRQRPPQHQDVQPGSEAEMTPPPQSAMAGYRGSGKLEGDVALITGGDSGIGRAVAVAFAKEGADVVVVYLNEEEDAQETRRLVEQTGRRCLLLRGDIGSKKFCTEAIEQALEHYERLDILVNNAGEQHPQKELADIDAEQLEQTFRTNVFAMFYLSQAAVPYLRGGGRIINTASVTAYRGSPRLLDYSASKGAVVAFTRSLAKALLEDGIRVNAVAPGPVWTPLIASTFSAGEVAAFGSQAPMKRAGQPDEIAPSYVFLASLDASYMAGQVLHPNGGEPING